MKFFVPKKKKKTLRTGEIRYIRRKTRILRRDTPKARTGEEALEGGLDLDGEKDVDLNKNISPMPRSNPEMAPP